VRNLDVVQQVPDFKFDAEQAQRIFGSLPPPIVGCQTTLIQDLERCAGRYLALRNQYKARWSRADQNAALKTICESATALSEALFGLDPNVEWSLDRFGGFKLEGLTALRQVLEDLAAGADLALTDAKAHRGPCHDPSIDRVLPRLASIFKTHTQKRFTHNSKNRLGYTGKLESAGGRFVRTFFGIVDPTARESEISTAMAFFVRNSKRRNSESNRAQLS
jgi:hypothetical protein